MKLWIARDNSGLYLFDSEPIKRICVDDKYFVWEDKRYSIDTKLFPEVIFENSPQKVELKLIKEE